MPQPWEIAGKQPWEIAAGTQVKQAPPGYGNLQPKSDVDLKKAKLEAQQQAATLAANVTKARNDAKKSGIDLQSAQTDLNIKQGTPPGDPSKYGDEYVATLPPGVRDLTQAMLGGKYKGNVTNSRNPTVIQAAIAAQHATHGQFDAGKYDERLALMKSMTDPNSSLGALNTALAHAGVLYDQASNVAGTSALGHNPFSVGLNAISNTWNSASPAVSTYEGTVGKYGPEQAKAYQIGTGGERQGIERQYSVNLPLDTKQALLKNDATLFSGKIASLAHGYDMLGSNSALDYLSPDAKAALQKIDPDTYQKIFGAVPGTVGNQPPAVPPSAPPPVAPMAGGPPPGTPPTADYSSMVGGPGSAAATMDPNSKLGAFKQTYRTVYDPVGAGALAALIRKGAPYDTAASYATSHGFNAPDPKDYAAAVSFAQQHKGAVNVEADRYAPTTLGERLSSSPAAAAVAGSAAGATAGLSDVVGRTIAGPAWDANRAALAATNPKSDFLGNLAGGAGGMLAGGGIGSNLLRAGESGGAARNSLAWLLKHPVAANAAGDTAYGTTYGASENPDNPLEGAGLGALVSPIASLAGYGASKTLGGLASGVTNPAVQRLKDAGIPLTVGEVLGPGAKKVQDAFSNIFPSIGKRYKEGRQAFNQAAFDQAGAPIGATSFSTGQSGINALADAKSSAYSSALDPININLNTPQFVGDMKNALNTASNINPAELPEGFAANQLRTSIGNQINNDGTMGGPAFQAAYRGLSKAAGSASSKVEGHDVGQALGQGQDALVNALSSDNPDAYNAFLNANRANRNLNVLSSAVNSAKNQDGQLFTPNQLGTASTANARSYESQIAAAGGYRAFNQLINDANSVMSSKLGDSGTFARLLAGNALLEGGGALGGYGKDGGNGALEGAEGGLGIYTLGSLLGSRSAQKLLVGSLIKRPQAARSLGDLLLNNPRYLAGASTAAQVPYFTTP